jgi:predicted ribosome quality control (RQC) complex YloA/Tae2 family protein
MAMNDREIEAVVGELRDRLAGDRGPGLQGAWQPTRDRVVLGFGDGSLLMIVPRGPFARLHLVRSRPANPPKPFSFQGACRAWLHGPLVAIERVPGDRVVRLSFARGALELRLTGRSSGLWLLDGATVVAAYDGPAPTELPELPPREAREDAPRFQPEEGSWNLAADRYFGGLERERERSERRTRVEQALTRAIHRNERLLDNLGDDLARADRAPVLRHQADLLASNVYRAKRGDSALIVEDWESGETVTLELDPSRPPTHTLDRLYHQAKRLERVADRVLARMDQVEAEQKAYRAALESLPTLTAEDLAKLEAKLPAGGPVRRKKDAASLPYVTWTGPNDLEVLVGRNAAGNRRLTFQVAKGHDWWMHLRGRPGAHLVLRVGKDRTPSLPHLLAAAQIALLVARVEPGEAAEVQYARVRDVRSIPGEQGLVTVADEKVLRVQRDPAALVGWVTTETG